MNRIDDLSQAIGSLQAKLEQLDDKLDKLEPVVDRLERYEQRAFGGVAVIFAFGGIVGAIVLAKMKAWFGF